MQRRSFLGWLASVPIALLFGGKSEARIDKIAHATPICQNREPVWTESPWFYVQSRGGFCVIRWVKKDDLSHLPPGEYKAYPYNSKARSSVFYPVRLIVLCPCTYDQHDMQEIFDNHDMIVGSGNGETVAPIDDGTYGIWQTRYIANLHMKYVRS